MLRKGMFISDRYEVIDKIGSGGMSDVYKTKDHKLNRFVAIKVLKSEFSEDKSFVTKFKVEAQSAAGLSHPNIVNVFDVGEEQGIHYIVMELIEGITLKKYIERKGRLSTKEAVSILIQVSQGIEAAHNNHIIHRDIKPQNIIISKEGKVKVTDFGIARAASANTISSNAMGSVHYISPEQAKGGFIDEKSDIYSLGITLYEMVTGRVPFEGDSTVAIALQHVQNELPSPKILAPELPVSVEKIIEKCTQKKPDRRYLKVSSLIADLKHSLIAPDEDFVKIVSGVDEKAVTRMISDEEVSRIRKESGFEKPELDIPVIGKDNELVEEEEEDEVEDDLEDYDDETNPKLDKIIAIGGIVTALVILVIVAFLIITIAGKGCSGSRGSSHSSVDSEEGETLDANHTKVPELEGIPQEEAIEKLKNATLGYKIEQEYDNKVTEGYVISASKEAGEIVEINTTITLVVSRGGKAFEIPDVVGKSKEEARKILKDLGVNVKIEYAANDTVPIDQVIKTEPTAPSQLRYGDDITIYVSSGTDATYVTVPKLIELSQDAAKASLDAQGLKLGEVLEEYSETVPKGKVCKQDLEPNSKTVQGTEVNIWLSKGPEEKPKVPNLVGKTEAQAKQALGEIGLEAGTISTEYSDSVPKGTVIRQATAVDTLVNKGTKINFTVSNGPEPTTTQRVTETTTQEPTTEPPTTQAARKSVNVEIQKTLLGDIPEDRVDDNVYIIISIEGSQVASIDAGKYSSLPNMLSRRFTVDSSYEVGTAAEVDIVLGSSAEDRIGLYSSDKYKVE